MAGCSQVRFCTARSRAPNSTRYSALLKNCGRCFRCPNRQRRDGRKLTIKKAACFKNRRLLYQKTCKPGFVRALPPRRQNGDGHSSGMRVTAHLVRPTRAAARKNAIMRPLFGLASGGVYHAAICCQPRGALLPHPFTLTRTVPKDDSGRFAFCCTFRRLAPPGRYPAPFFREARTFLTCPKASAAIRSSDGGNMGDAPLKFKLIIIKQDGGAPASAAAPPSACSGCRGFAADRTLPG